MEGGYKKKEGKSRGKPSIKIRFYYHGAQNDKFALKC